ncbi:hypothetical protein [Mycobacterium uberis]|uniref:hypothetical protein n=1 Tax=Mycobacterium uberis TaxID=2162698 RepID=UPI001402C186|nr:hypothetical protein [Mycobacterium uberis]
MPAAGCASRQLRLQCELAISWWEKNVDAEDRQSATDALIAVSEYAMQSLAATFPVGV